MKKNLFTFIFLFQIWILIAQKTQSELIIGTWRFQKNCDLRSEMEKSEKRKHEFVEASWCPPETENETGYPDKTFKKNGEYIDYFTSTNVQHGKWKIENGNLILISRISKKVTNSYKDRMDKLLKKGAITKGEDGYLYQKPIVIQIKLISEVIIEFGNDMVYSIHEKISKTK